MAALGPSSSALELAAALRSRELSAVELLDACLASVDERNPQIKAVSYFNSNPDGNHPDQQFLLSDDPPALAAFTTIARSAYFNAHPG